MPEGLALSDSEKEEALADSLQTQFQPVDHPTHPAVLEKIIEAMGSSDYAPASEPKLTSPSEVIQATGGIKGGKAPCVNGIPNWVLRHVSKRTITFLTKVFTAVLRRQYFPLAWKHARVVSTVKPGKDPMLPFSNRPINLLGIVRNLFEKIQLTGILQEVSERGLLRYERFGFRLGHSITLRLARLFERLTREL
jgi:hypothetical protein